MSYGYRPWGERELLKAEAELRVRSGQARADVARALGIPGSTLAQWACDGGWRLKDIEAETDRQRVQDCGERLRQVRRKERQQFDALEAAISEVERLIAMEGPRISAPRRIHYQERIAQTLDAVAERTERTLKEQGELAAERREALARYAAEDAANRRPREG